MTRKATTDTCLLLSLDPDVINTHSKMLAIATGHILSLWVEASYVHQAASSHTLECVSSRRRREYTGPTSNTNRTRLEHLQSHHIQSQGVILVQQSVNRLKARKTTPDSQHKNCNPAWPAWQRVCSVRSGRKRAQQRRKLMMQCRHSSKARELLSRPTRL